MVADDLTRQSDAAQAALREPRLFGRGHLAGLAADELDAAGGAPRVATAGVEDVYARVLLDREDEPLSLLHINRVEPFDSQIRHVRYVNVSDCMSDVSAIPRPSQLWKQLPADRRLDAAEAFWRDDGAEAEQAEVIAAIAQRIKFRMKSVIVMPDDKKARQLASLPAISEVVAARLLIAYHLAHQRPMMGAFLSALGIAHEDGLIADEEVPPPDPGKLKAAATTLAGSHSADDVALYLSMLTWQDPDTWGPLADAPETRQPSREPGRQS